MQFLFNIVAGYYGLQLELDNVLIKKTVTKYYHLKREVISKTSVVPLNYILTILFGLITNGLLYPINVSLRFIVIESKRIGKSKSLDPSFGEKIRIIFFSIFGMWLIYTVLKYVSWLNPVISAYAFYTYKFLLIFTISSIIPFGMILAPLVVKKFGYEFTTNFIGDLLIFSNRPTYAALVFTLIFLPIFSIFLDPVLFSVFVTIIYSVVWLRTKYLVEVS